MEAITIRNVSKSYGKDGPAAVNDVSLGIRQGELFGLIGPDGAGKTSLMRMLATLLLPDAGSLQVFGHDVVRDYATIRSIVGYMPGRFSLYQDLSVEENLQFFATLFGTTIRANYHLIEDIYVQLEPFKDRRAGKLSGGMKQKLALCCALIHKPRFMILDEPTTGVDPVSRKEFWDMLDRLKRQEITIVVSTPYMDEAAMCDRIALMQSGRILSVDTPDGIVHSYTRPLYAIASASMYELQQELRSSPLVHSCLLFGEYLHITLEHGASEADLHAALLPRFANGFELKQVLPTIEDCFIELMGNESGAAHA